MLKVNQFKLSMEEKEDQIPKKLAKLLRVPESEIEYQILKKSIDSRKKPDLFWVYSLAVSVKNDATVLKKVHSKDVSIYKENVYRFPENGDISLMQRPVIVGAGPAGLFCALSLVQKGFEPIIIERGKPVEERLQDVTKFWETGLLDPSSNAVFGEGGAGTFSDGKLNTSVKDPAGRIHQVLSWFVEFGAKNSILYDNKPHVGTDELVKILKNIREYLISKGCDFNFQTKFIGFETKNDQLCSIKAFDDKLKQELTIKTSALILALGHGAEDTFEMLFAHHLIMEAKPFAVGYRVEHPQNMINEFAYGKTYANKLPASPYKVVSNFPNNRGVYSFCMCPGGYVVNSSSKEKHLVVNGMSYSKRDSANANSAIIVSVGEREFDLKDPLGGLKYQKKIERNAFEIAKGKIPQQLFGDFRLNRDSTNYGDYQSVTKGDSELCSVRNILSKDLEETFILGMEHFGNIIPGFDRYDAILSGVESRTSSPIRILRNENFESNIGGLYPCGEGAGYAGGITSAAMDGMKVAEKIISKYRPA